MLMILPPPFWALARPSAEGPGCGAEAEHSGAILQLLRQTVPLAQRYAANLTGKLARASMPMRLCHRIASELVRRRMPGKRTRMRSNAIEASARASWNPRQKCIPVPKERCGFG